jgi:superfamily II DNA or RNA helicase
MLRGYQRDIVQRCNDAWANGLRNLMPVCATGSGKTKIMSCVAASHGEPGVAIAHRSVLIGQISLALAAEGVVHDIVAPKNVVRTIVTAHMDELGRNYYNPSSHWKVASVDTLPGRIDHLAAWAKRVTLGFTDESHHTLAGNKWGRACAMFPQARWLLPTATPERADGKGLGRDSDGIADAIIEGPPMRWLIDNGYLTDYIIRAPLPADLNLADVQVGSNGEYNQVQLRKAVHRSAKIIGNVVDTYLSNTPKKLGIVFAVDIEHAKALTKEFLAKGVAAELITADSTEEERRATLKRYRNRETLVLVNVDLFGEGFDLPAIEVVMFARPTASYALYAQQFGRALRLLLAPGYMDNWENYTPAQRLAVIAQSPKPVAHVHDHVGNVLHFFGPPDKPREWSLEPRSSRRSGPTDAIPLRVCSNAMCLQPFERFYPACPYCGTPVPVPAGASLPEQVDGDITLYTPEMLRRIFGVDSVQDALEKQPSEFCAIPPGVSTPTIHAIQRLHQVKLQQQAKLAQLMPLLMPPTRNERENMRRFFLQYGVDVVSARLLGAKETEALNAKVLDSLTGNR